jgi:hypothetical protein
MPEGEDGQDWSGSGEVQMAHACERGNETMGTIKGMEFLD